MLIIALLASAGGVFASLMGWANAHEPFNARKFISSIGVAVFSGIAVALLYQNTDVIGARDYLLAFASGAGMDGVANRAWGTIKR